jgi:hypothetical protein
MLLPPPEGGRPPKTERPQRVTPREHPINHHVTDPEPRVADRDKPGRPHAQHPPRPPRPRSTLTTTSLSRLTPRTGTDKQHSSDARRSRAHAAPRAVGVRADGQRGKQAPVWRTHPHRRASSRRLDATDRGGAVAYARLASQRPRRHRETLARDHKLACRAVPLSLLQARKSGRAPRARLARHRAHHVLIVCSSRAGTFGA